MESLQNQNVNAPIGSNIHSGIHASLSPREPRVAVLWTGLSGYLAACLRALKQRGAALFVAHTAIAKNAPFDSSEFAFFDRSHAWTGGPNASKLLSELRDFNPDAVLCAGWHVDAYRKMMLEFAGKVPRVMTMDNQWRGTPKQWLGIASSRFCVRPLSDYVWVPGERQAQFARRLGFEQSRIMRGMLSADTAAFSDTASARRKSAARANAFLYAGRFVPEKGLDVLMDAYRQYRHRSSDPWPFIACGQGPQAHLLANQPGVTVTGFVQPRNLPSMFGQASCFVLPSRFEPWGVVVHEACAAGMSVIATTEVGASVHLVQDGYNGYTFGPGDRSRLAELLWSYSNLPEENRRLMSERSAALAGQFTPERWASYLLGRVQLAPLAS
jgi:glycosyltransferase involved in cell wall biosynthesis